MRKTDSSDQVAGYAVCYETTFVKLFFVDRSHITFYPDQRMNGGQRTQRSLANVGLSALGALLIGSILLFREHLFFADLSFGVFNIINNKEFAIVSNRYGAFITQIIPFLAQKLHLPISIVLIGFSASFNLFFFFVNALIIYRLKQYPLAILMAIYYFLFVSDSFFMAGDTQVAVAWMFLFFAVLIHLGQKKVHPILLALPFLLLFLAVSAHFVVIIPTVFLWVYFILEAKNWPFSTKNSVLFSFLLVGIIVGMIVSAPAQSHDGGQLHNILHISLKDIIESFSAPVVVTFLGNCLTNYWIAVIVLAAGMVSLWRCEKKLLLAWTIISCIGYLVIMGITYTDFDANFLLCHIELEWGSLAVIIAAPFAFAYLPKLKPSLAIGFLTVIFIVRLAYIGTAYPAFAWRTQFKDDVKAHMKQKGITKLALYADSAIARKFMIDWTVPYETILSSALDGDHPQLTFTFVYPGDKDMINRLKDRKSFNALWEMRPYTALNKEYFSIDTTTPYSVMTYAELLK